MGSAGNLSTVREQLASLPAWSPVSRKTDILRVLERSVGKDERIVALLEGFFSGREGSHGGRASATAGVSSDRAHLRARADGVSGAYGVLCVTDRRILFAPGESSRAAVGTRFGEV